MRLLNYLFVSQKIRNCSWIKQLKSDIGIPRCLTHLMLLNSSTHHHRSMLLLSPLAVFEDVTFHRCFLYVISGNKTMLRSDHLHRTHVPCVCVCMVTTGVTSHFQSLQKSLISTGFPNTWNIGSGGAFSFSESKSNSVVQLSTIKHENQIKRPLLCVLGFLTRAHLSFRCLHAGSAVAGTCWLIALLFALLWYFSLVVMSRPRGGPQSQSGNMDFSFPLQRRRSGGARGSHLLGFNLPSGCNLLWFTQGEQRLL